MIDVCVIGAGVAGLSAAGELQRGGRSVVVLEKSRGLGGRAATRRIEGNRVDHGAQYFTVRDPRFRERVDAWLAEGHLRVWAEGFHELRADGALEEPSGGHPRYVFPHGMSTLGRLLAEGIEVRRSTRATRLRPGADGWRISVDGDDAVSARRVLLATPAAQALELLPETIAPEPAARLRGVAFEPCWAVMAGYPRERAPAWAGVRLEANPVVAWAAHDSDKRVEAADTVLVLHSTPAFARSHERGEEQAVVRRMLDAASALGDWIARPRWTDTQRWRYARASAPLDAPFLDLGNGVFVCGDWCGGARVEAAYRSGAAVAAAMAGRS